MAAQQGRDVVLKRSDMGGTPVFTAVAGAVSTGWSMSNGEVDITTNDEDGVKTLLAGKYSMGGSCSLSGVCKDDAIWALMRTAFLTGAINNYKLVTPGATGGGTYSFAASIPTFEETGEMDGALSFTMTLNASGPITYAL